MFKILGVLLLGYVGYGLTTRQIYGKYRAWGRTFQREEEPWNYWSTIVAYSALAVALFFFGSR
jgi:hypothetical protein